MSSAATRYSGLRHDQPGLPPWGPHVRFRRVQTLVREGSPLVKVSAFANCGRAVAHVRDSYVPQKVTSAPQRWERYSITSSARASSMGGMVMPSALAVLRFITSSNFVGCSMGRSAGFAPFRMASRYLAARRYRSMTSGP